jgi:xanthine dehydrogenase YagR molybdenum-binding subunit
MADGTPTKIKVGFAGQTRDIEVLLPADEPKPWDAASKLEVVGKSVPRLDGAAKVTGAARYTHDIRLPGMLFAAVLRSPHACATLTGLDLEAARSAPGVAAVLPLAKVGERLLFAGQDVAAVAATSPQLAQAALRRISATYPGRAARRDDAGGDAAGRAGRAQAGQGRGAGDRGRRAGRGRRGGDAGQRARDAVDEEGRRRQGAAPGKRSRSSETYTTQVHTHSALETHSLVVRWDSDKQDDGVVLDAGHLFGARRARRDF